MGVFALKACALTRIDRALEIFLKKAPEALRTIDSRVRLLSQGNSLKRIPLQASRMRPQGDEIPVASVARVICKETQNQAICAVRL